MKHAVFAHGMPVREALQHLPNWMLDAVGEEDEAGSRVNAVVVYLTVFAMGLADPDKEMKFKFDPENPPVDLVLWMSVECSFEWQRRVGLIRFSGGAESINDIENDRLHVQWNPALLHLVAKGPIADNEVVSRMEEMLKISLQTDWADLEALAGE